VQLVIYRVRCNARWGSSSNGDPTTIRSCHTPHQDETKSKPEPTRRTTQNNSEDTRYQITAVIIFFGVRDLPKCNELELSPACVLGTSSIPFAREDDRDCSAWFSSTSSILDRLRACTFEAERKSTKVMAHHIAHTDQATIYNRTKRSGLGVGGRLHCMLP
jgi:hypothetical protein